MNDPKRIVDDATAPEGLRSLLAEARRDPLDSAAAARVRERLEAVLGPQGFTTSGSAGLGAKLVLSLGIGVAVVIGAISAAPKDPVPTAYVALATFPSPEVVVSPTPRANALVKPSVAPKEAPASSPRPIRSPKSSAAAEASGEPREEFELLLSARRALETSPERALQLVQRHARSFPQSALAEEREVIAIQALVRTGQGTAAERRGRAFLAAYPGSSHTSAVQSALSQSEADSL